MGCSSCHLQGSDGRGPSLYGIYEQPRILNNGNEVVADISYLRESILHPQAKIVSGYEPIMPVFAGQINEQTLGQLIAYIKSLKKEKSHIKIDFSCENYTYEDYGKAGSEVYLEITRKWSDIMKNSSTST